jgi:hypothetical protein
MTTEQGNIIPEPQEDRLPKEIKTPIVTLLNEIYKMPDDSLLEKITTYCQETDIREEDIAEVLKESEQFKRALWLSCVENFQIKDAQVKHLLENTEELEEWF